MEIYLLSFYPRLVKATEESTPTADPYHSPGGVRASIIHRSQVSRVLVELSLVSPVTSVRLPPIAGVALESALT